MARRRGPSTPPYGRGPPPHGFAAGRIWIAAPHPKTDVARSLSPRPLLGFDDPPDHRVADDVAPAGPAAVDPPPPPDPRAALAQPPGPRTTPDHPRRAPAASP